MATFDYPILNHSLMPDSSGDVFPAPVSTQLTMTNAKRQNCIVMQFPTGSDVGFELNFKIPQNYVGTPKLLIQGILDGTPANVLAFGAQQLSRADSEAVDTAYEAEDTVSNSTWTGYSDEDMYEDEITLTPASAYVVNDTVYLSFFRDDSVDTTTFNFLLTDLFFRYDDA